MIYSFYKEEKRVIIEGITDLELRLKYLYKEKDHFESDNSGPDADQIVKWFDSLIDQTKFEITTRFSTQTESQKSPNKRQKLPVDENITLDRFFIDVSKYKTIMEKLVEYGYCQEHTYIWIHKSKDSLVYLFKYLHAQGYYRRNRKPLNKEMVLIAINTFSVNISESYIKQCDSLDPLIKKIIPVASTLV